MTKQNRKHIEALDLFQIAQDAITDAGYAWEIEWQRTRSFDRFTEQELLREAAWVILCSGFSETSVRKHFDKISLCFCDWESAQEISYYRNQCVATAKSIFRHDAKIHAIANVAAIIQNSGFDDIQLRIFENPIEELRQLPFIGPVTSWHLAKNLGLNVAKNDRHLARLAKNYGYSDAHDLCDYLSKETGEMRSVVDVILWRFSSLNQFSLASSS